MPHTKLSFLQFSNFHPQQASKFFTSLHLLIIGILLSLCTYIFFTAFLGSVETTLGLQEEEFPFHDNSIVQSQPKKTKLIFMLVDAMRYDMIQEAANSDASSMPFLSSKLQENKVLFMKAKSEPPTVTLPRLKALTTGMKPVFLDILKNVEDQTNPDKYAKLQFDSWLQRFHEKNASIFMCGDATWQNLFPTEYFQIIDPTTSLYVHDTVEVDVNVTRNLDWILREEQTGEVVESIEEISWMDTLTTGNGNNLATEMANDWNVTILHYLGLDHVGHVGGIFHPLMKPKQQEMDSVVQRIYQWMMNREEDDVVFLLASDHGMNADGNHGGASDEEVDSFFVFMSKGLDRGSRGDTKSEYPTVAQRDLVPTLAALFSLPVPEFSLGKMIAPVVQSLQGSDSLLMGYERNAYQLMSLLRRTADLWTTQSGKDNNPESAQNSRASSISQQTPISKTLERLITQYSRATSLEDYSSFVSEASDFLLQRSSKIHIDMIIIAMAGFAICAFVFLVNGWSLYSRVRFQFQYSYLTAFFILIGHVFYSFGCSRWGDSCAAEACSPQNHLIIALFVVSASFCLETIIVGAWNQVWTKLSLSRKNAAIHQSSHPDVVPSNMSFYFLFLPLLFQLVSLTSSSLIEEEHLLWYYACASTMVCAMIYGMRYNRKLALICFVMLIIFSICRVWNQSGIKYRSDLDLFKLLVYWNKSSSAAVSAYVAIASLIVYSIFEIYAFWVASTALWVRSHMKRALNNQTALLLLTNLFIIMYKFGVEVLGSSSWWFRILAPQLTYASLLLLLVFTVLQIPTRENILISTAHVLTRFFSAFISLQFLLQKSDNAPLVLGINMLCFLSFQAIRISKWNVSHPLELIIFCHSMGMACFYMFGNSISISSVDFSGAYIGFSSFQQEIVGFLIVCLYYTGPIVFDLTTVVSLTNRPFFHTVSMFALFKVSMRAFSMFIFSIMIYAMRSHLFIWSVFSPKLLQESFLTLYTVAIMILLHGFISTSMAYYNDAKYYRVKEK